MSPAPNEEKNGWSEAELAAYVEERDKAANRVPGLVVTEWERPRPAMRIESALKFNPHKWR